MGGFDVRKYAGMCWDVLIFRRGRCLAFYEFWLTCLLLRSSLFLYSSFLVGLHCLSTCSNSPMEQLRCLRSTFRPNRLFQPLKKWGTMLNCVALPQTLSHALCFHLLREVSSLFVNAMHLCTLSLPSASANQTRSPSSWIPPRLSCWFVRWDLSS